MHFDELLDLGYDYGATGGHGWATTVIQYPNGRTRRNVERAIALGAWELGNRNIDLEQLEKIRGFFHAMRGRAHSFLYKDWNDFIAKHELLVIDGTYATQLTKAYGASINVWFREIKKPVPGTVLIEAFEVGEWVALDPSGDYELDHSTGIVTWSTPPDTSAQIRWSGEFNVPVRFDRDQLDVQFLGVVKEADGERDYGYHLGGLGLVEEPDLGEAP